jgi:hypothetical protein
MVNDSQKSNVQSRKSTAGRRWKFDVGCVRAQHTAPSRCEALSVVPCTYPGILKGCYGVISVSLFPGFPDKEDKENHFILWKKWEERYFFMLC